MTVGASKAATTIRHKPALAPSLQPRPAPTARALPSELVAQRGPFWMPIRGPDPTPIDTAPSLVFPEGPDKVSPLLDLVGGGHSPSVAVKQPSECDFQEMRVEAARHAPAVSPLKVAP